MQELCDSLDPGDVQAFFDRGDSRAMALAGALSRVLQALTGFTNKSLRALVADHLGQRYTQSQMRYDLRRLRLHGLIQRLPRSNTYQLTSEGIRVAVFYTKLQNRLLRPLLDANKPPARIEIRRALTTLEHAMNEYVQNAPLAPAPQLHAFPGRSRTSPLVRSASPMSE